MPTENGNEKAKMCLKTNRDAVQDAIKFLDETTVGVVVMEDFGEEGLHRWISDETSINCMIMWLSLQLAHEADGGEHRNTCMQDVGP